MSVGCGLGAVGHVDLAEDVADVSYDGVRADIRYFPDEPSGFVNTTFRDNTDYMAASRCCQRPPTAQISPHPEKQGVHIPMKGCKRLIQTDLTPKVAHLA